MNEIEAIAAIVRWANDRATDAEAQTAVQWLESNGWERQPNGWNKVSTSR